MGLFISSPPHTHTFAKITALRVLVSGQRLLDRALRVLVSGHRLLDRALRVLVSGQRLLDTALRILDH